MATKLRKAFSTLQVPIIVRLILRGSNNKKTKYSKQVATNSSKTSQKKMLIEI